MTSDVTVHTHSRPKWFNRPSVANQYSLSVINVMTIKVKSQRLKVKGHRMIINNVTGQRKQPCHISTSHVIQTAEPIGTKFDTAYYSCTWTVQTKFGTNLSARMLVGTYAKSDAWHKRREITQGYAILS